MEKDQENYKKIEKQKMEESLGIGKKSYGPDTETWPWFRSYTTK
jgi:hypothetical protein